MGKGENPYGIFIKPVDNHIGKSMKEIPSCPVLSHGPQARLMSKGVQSVLNLAQEIDAETGGSSLVKSHGRAKFLLGLVKNQDVRHVRYPAFISAMTVSAGRALAEPLSTSHDRRLISSSISG
jgi:hypothetical protein